MLSFHVSDADANFSIPYGQVHEGGHHSRQLHEQRQFKDVMGIHGSSSNVCRSVKGQNKLCRTHSQRTQHRPTRRTLDGIVDLQ